MRSARKHNLRYLHTLHKRHHQAVFIAVSPDDEKVIVKVAKPPFGDNLESEYKLSEVIYSIPKKPNDIIPKPIDFWHEDGVQCLMMEFVEGQELFAIAKEFWWVGKQKRRHTRNEMDEWLVKVQKWFGQLVEKLDFLQSNRITHNDLSPENAIICPRGDLHLIDYGLSKQHESDSFQTLNPRHVKRAYTAPEAWNRDGPEYDASLADIFSAGVTLFFLLGGEIDVPKKNEEKDDNDDRPFLEYFLQNGRDGLATFFRTRGLKMYVPDDAVDLLSKIFVYESDRIGMTDLKNHPFVAGRRYADVAELEDGTFGGDVVFANDD